MALSLSLSPRMEERGIVPCAFVFTLFTFCPPFPPLLAKVNTMFSSIDLRTSSFLVLRFIAFYKSTYLNYKSPIKSFLNDTMRNNAAIDAIEMKRIKDAFHRAVANLTSLLGSNCFRRYKLGDNKQGSWEKNRLNVALYDILMDSMARHETSVIMRHLDAIREAYIDLMVSNQEFIDSIMIQTSDKIVVQKRFDIWRRTLEEIIQDDKLETRCFSYELKMKLYNENPTCAICGQHISTIDDSAVDHIEQYWMGGKTIPENARLTHRYCNWSRSRNDIVQTKGD